MAQMTLTGAFLAELDREGPRTRRAPEQVPLGKDDWIPHPKSMSLGRLAGLVASMASWVSLILGQDELDLTPPGGGTYKPPVTNELVSVHDGHIGKAREAHLAHHRGQLTVYLRMNECKVPAIYGPSADDRSFA